MSRDLINDLESLTNRVIERSKGRDGQGLFYHSFLWQYAELVRQLLRRNAIDIKVIIKDDMPAFAGFLAGSVTEGEPIVAISLQNMLGAYVCVDVPREELPYMIAECLMHEIVHALEELFDVPFSEEKIEGLIEEYQKRAQETPSDD